MLSLQIKNRLNEKRPSTGVPLKEHHRKLQNQLSRLTTTANKHQILAQQHFNSYTFKSFKKILTGNGIGP